MKDEAQPATPEAKTGAAKKEEADEDRKIVLPSPPTPILALQTAVRKVAGQRFDQAEKPRQAALSTQDTRSFLFHGPLTLRRQLLQEMPQWRSLTAIRRAARVLDELRLRAPLEAAQLAQILAAEVAPRIKGSEGVEAFCRAAGALGSSHRLAASMEAAAFCLETALEIGHWAPPRVRADLLRRTSIVLGGHGEFEDALTVSGEAMAIFVAQRDRAGMGKVFVDQGVFSVALDREAARDSYEVALALLPDSEKSHRAAAYQGLAHLRELDKKFDEAEEHLLVALALIPPATLYPRAMAQWSVGMVAKGRGQLDRAEAYLRLAVEGLVATDPFSLALASLDLVELLLSTGQASEATERAKTMAALLKPLRHNQTAIAAIRRFTYVARRGEVTAATVIVLREVVEGERCKGIRPPTWR